MWKTRAFVRLGLVAVACCALGLGPKGALAQEAEPRGEGETDVAAPPSSEMLEITGTIEAAERDILGEAVQLRIVSEQGAFLISGDGKGDELKGHVGAKVTVTAQRVRDDKGNELLSVQGYELDES